MATVDDYRESAEECEALARSASTVEEKIDLLDTARALRQAAAELEASAATVRQLDQRKRYKPGRLASLAR
jgi:hypothetical protein